MTRAGSIASSPGDRAALCEWPTNAGPADYALRAEGDLVGVVEAKREGLAVGEVLSQAERYAGAYISGAGGRCYAYAHDMLAEQPRSFGVFGHS